MALNIKGLDGEEKSLGYLKSRISRFQTLRGIIKSCNGEKNQFITGMNILHIKLEKDHVTILDSIIFSFLADFSRFP